MHHACDSCSCQLPSLIYLGIKTEEQLNGKDNAIYHMPVDGRGHDPTVALGKSRAFLVITVTVKSSAVELCRSKELWNCELKIV